MIQDGFLDLVHLYLQQQIVLLSLHLLSINKSLLSLQMNNTIISQVLVTSYNIFDGTDVSETMLDQKLLKIVRKTPTTTTEIYKTPKRDVGILLNGVPIYGYKDSECSFWCSSGNQG